MKKYLLIIGILCSLLTQSITAFASPEDDQLRVQLQKMFDASGMTQCRTALAPLFDLELKQFMEFLDTTFQNKSNNSSLTNLAIARYQGFKENLNQLFSQVSINNSDENIIAAQDAYALCANVKDEYFTQAKKVLIDHIKKTAAVKSASIMLEKYQAINSKLRDLNTAIVQMYGYFMTFKSVLPGFISKCITSG